MDNKKIKALLIEDNPGDVGLILEMLTDSTDSPFTLESAGSLSEGLEQLSQKSFDVIMSDLGLPDSQGLETFFKIQAQAARVPIVVLSGMNDESVAISAVQSGAQDYLVKGKVDSDSLRRSLLYAIERKQIQEDLRIKDRVIESSINPIAIASLKGKLTYVNYSFLKLWKYKNISEVTGSSIEEFWDKPAEALWIMETLLSNGSWIGKIRGRGKDDSELDLQLSAFVVKEKDETGEPLCLVFSFVDITELTKLHRRLKTEQSFAGIVGYDTKMLELFDVIRQVAKTDVPVLIHGESGTGKELVATAIHNESPHHGKPFIPLNCSELSEEIMESELFGHIKGAFAEATSDKKGCLESADSGTIFLNEIGDLSMAMQAKLLQVLQKGVFRRIGGEDTIKVDARIISSTNKNIAEEVTAGRFEEELFYKLCVVPLRLPPLRARRNDIPVLADYLLKKALTETGRKNVTLSTEAIDTMMNYDWPGNVRELGNAIKEALARCKGNQLLSEHLFLKPQYSLNT